MIVTHLTGGLGNQMFQYATGKRISVILKTRLFLDTSFYDQRFDSEKVTPRNFELGIFNLDVTHISGLKSSVYRIFLKNKVENSLNFNKNLLDEKSRNVYLDGYWQSEKYFLSIEETIRKDFEFKIIPHESIMKYIKAIKQKNTVGIHVRRTDYVTVKKVNTAHGVCEVNYYNKAIELVAKKVKSPVFYVFSDDKNWARNNIISKHRMIYVNHSGEDYEDMRLMSFCKHNIIANSSFSWWGAWLNKNKKKIVVAPKKWSKQKDQSYEDIIPKQWIRL